MALHKDARYTLDWIYIDDAVKAVKGVMLFGVILLIKWMVVHETLLQRAREGIVTL